MRNQQALKYVIQAPWLLWLEAALLRVIKIPIPKIGDFNTLGHFGYEMFFRIDVYLHIDLFLTNY